MAITPSPVPRGPVTATLNFSHPPLPGVTAVNYVEDPPAGEPKRNLVVNPQPVQINDIRGRESEFSLDHDAFLPIPAPSSSSPDAAPSSNNKKEVVDFNDETSITTNYYPEVKSLLLTHVPNATRVQIFDHTVRRSSTTARRAPRTVHPHRPNRPIRSPTHPPPPPRRRRHPAPGRGHPVPHHQRLAQPQRPPHRVHPLAFASSASFRDRDAIPVEHRYPGGYTGQTAAVAHHPDQKWYYWSGMTPDERLLLECFDSESLRSEGNTEVRGGRTPHSAFEDPRRGRGPMPRGGRVSRLEPWFLDPERSRRTNLVRACFVN
ncbi:hypothetical protein PG993_008315 [Apiospora rasikravindrae]|uniref:Uncharacterized protein n=1 Tax=Apiospora rasikravindrae TaxID=990691 RepID=A0ABR1T1V5_9PEZI